MGWGRVRSKDAQELCQLIRMILFAAMRAVVYFIHVTTSSLRRKINFPIPALSAGAFAAHHRTSVDYSGPCSSSCSMAQQGRPEDTAKHHGSKGMPCGQLLERCELCKCRGFLCNRGCVDLRVEGVGYGI